jgi:arylsulfatase A-like enzyme
MPRNERPNVLIFLSDQLRRHVHGCYGDPNVATPAVDRLAERGVRFSNACSTYPVCVPFRFSLMTGHTAHSRAVPSILWRMSPKERTLADELNDAGYKTVYVGKWHLDGNCNEFVDRERQGRWQRWIGHEGQTGRREEGRGRRHRDIQLVDSKTMQWRQTSGFTTDAVVDTTMEALREEMQPGQPFCCVCSVLPPHPPMDPPDEEMERWENRDFEMPPNVEFTPREYPEVRGDFPNRWQSFDEEHIFHRWRAYYAMVENLDANLGRIMRFLEDEGVADNTIVVYLSDHGELAGCHGLTGKQFPFEESVGIPLIVHDPRRPQDGGRVVEEPVGPEDVFPTILGLCGLQPQDDLPGFDCTGLVRGEAEELDRPGVLLEFVRDLRPNQPFYRQGWRGVRTRDSVYVTLGGRPWLYYDLSEDPYQLVNLVDDESRRDELMQHQRWLQELMDRTGDDYELLAEPLEATETVE